MKPFYKLGNDLKFDITIKDGETTVAPDTVPITVLLWTNRKAESHRCGWDGTAWFGGASKSGNVMHVAFDAPARWEEGEIHGEAILHYPDAEMPDKVNDKTVMVTLEYDEMDATITGVASHVCYGLSAYDLAVQQGYVGTLTQWLASLKGETGSTGATGATGAAGRDGADGNILYPSMGINAQGEMYVEMPDTQNETNLSIDSAGYLCQNLPNLL